MFSRQLDLFQQPLTLDLYDKLPELAYCSDDLEGYGCHLREKHRAVKKKYLGYNKGIIASVILDLDYPSYFAWKDESALPPNYIIRNPKNQHTHYLYVLTNPVRKYDCQNTKPMRKLAAVTGALTSQLKADQMYSGYIAKSLWNDSWKATLLEPMAYDLDFLKSEIPDHHFKNRIRNSTASLDPMDYTSRNVWVFDNVRKYAYRFVRSCKSVTELYEGLWKKCMELNHSFPPLCHHQEPMRLTELQGICRSISKWVWARFSPEEFSRIQSFRGSLKGKKKKELLLPKVIELVAQGRSHRSIAKELGISPPTITNWLKV